jgi:hypothetical protein
MLDQLFARKTDFGPCDDLHDGPSLKRTLGHGG